MPDPKQNLDLWAKLEQLAPEKRGNYRVEVDRISPEYDPVSDTPISGFVKEMPLNEFTRDSLLRLVGGGTYRVSVRLAVSADPRKRGTFFTRQTVNFAGPPRIPYSRSQGYNSPGDQQQGQSGQPGGYNQGYQDAIKEFKHERELEAIQRQIEKLGDRMQLGGNGQKHGDQLVVDMIKVLSPLLNKDSNMSFTELYTLLKGERDTGEKRAKDMYELIKDSGIDPETVVESKMADAVIELIKSKRLSKGKEKKNIEPAKITGDKKKDAQIVQAAFEHIRNNIAGTVSEFSGFAGSAIKGSTTLEELLANVEDLLEFAGLEKQEEEEETDLEEEQKKTEEQERELEEKKLEQVHAESDQPPDVDKTPPGRSPAKKRNSKSGKTKQSKKTS